MWIILGTITIMTRFGPARGPYVDGAPGVVPSWSGLDGVVSSWRVMFEWVGRCEGKVVVNGHRFAEKAYVWVFFDSII